jgi:hypothetical protein
MSWVDVTTAVGTAGAAVVALGLGLRAEWRAIRAEREAKTENERRQAVHVAAWILVEHDNGDGPREVEWDGPSSDERGAHDYAVVQNASEEPIWEIFVDVPTMHFKGESNPPKWIAVIGPHETYKVEITEPAILFNRIPLKVQFQDNAGRNWFRDGEGVLHGGRTGKKARIDNT